MLCVFGDVSEDFIDVADCAVSEEEQLSGVSWNNLSTDKVLNSPHDLRPSKVCLHRTDLFHCLLDGSLFVSGTLLEEIPV